MWDARVCVACLATDVKMYSMSASSLLQPYQLLAGVQLDKDNDYYLPKKLCWECAALVNKFNLFRHKCERAYLLLQDIYHRHDEIIEDYVKEIDRERHSLSCSCSITHISNYTLESRNVEITQDTSREPLVAHVKQEFEVQIMKSEDDLAKCEPDLPLNEPSTNTDCNEEAESDLENPPQEPGEGESSLRDLNVVKKGLQEISLQEEVFKSQTYECDVCKLRFNNLRNIRRHIRSQHAKQYTFNIGQVNHFSRYTTQRHLKQHQKHGPVLKEAQMAESKLDKKAGNVLKTKLKKKKQKLKNSLEVVDLGFAKRPLTQEQMMEVMRDKQLAKGYAVAPFKCHLCFKIFIEKRTYSEHMTLHDQTRGDFECDICKTRKRTRRLMWEHITRIHLYKYTCDFCPKVSCGRRVAREHYQTHKGVNFMCHICAKTFSRDKAMKRHVHKKHPSFMTCNVCGDCGSSFLTSHGLDCHKYKMHQVAAAPEENAPYCEGCKVQFASRKAWTKHVLNSESHKDLQKDIANGCMVCGETFNTNAALRRHRKEEHADKNFAKKAVKQAMKHPPCTLCGEQLTSSKGRWDHHRRCHPGQPYPRLKPARHACEQCGKGFPSMTTLEQHRAVHTGPPPLKCDVCPKAFYMQSALRAHVTIHTDEKPYKCDTCEMQFKVKASLTKHKHVHTGERPYPCTKCEKAFTTRHSLQIHVRRMHNKEHIPSKPRVRKRKPPV